MEKQAKEILAYEITIDSQKKALVQLGVDIETIKQINSGLSNVERENAENASKLADKLSNLGTYAKEKPDIVQRLVNESADMRIRCFALATGAKPLENEVNNVCPHLLPKVGSDD